MATAGDDITRVRQHMAATYRSLRAGMTGITLGFPFFLWWFGLLWYGVPHQHSLSEYYTAPPATEWAQKGGPVRQWFASLDVPVIRDLLSFTQGMNAEAPLRTWFVGLLFMLGISLMLYEGNSKWENFFLDAAGAFALGVAIFPTGCQNCLPLILFGWKLTVHDISAVLAFFCLGLVSFHNAVVMNFIHSRRRGPLYPTLYAIAAVLMIGLPLTAVGLNAVFGTSAWQIYWVEVAGLGAFAFYWIVKGWELNSYGA